DEIIGLNWPFVSVSAGTLANHTPETVTLHSMEPGQTVGFALGAGQFRMGNFGSVMDNGDGTYSIVFTPTASNTPDSAPVIFSIAGQSGVTLAPTIKIVAGPPALLFIYFGNYQGTRVGSAFPLTLQFQVRDASANPV